MSVILFATFTVFPDRIEESRSIVVVQGALVSLLGGHESLMTKLISKTAWAPSLMLLVSAMLHVGVWGLGRVEMKNCSGPRYKVLAPKNNDSFTSLSLINVLNLFKNLQTCHIILWPSLTRFSFAKAVTRRPSLSDVPPQIRVTGPCIDQSEANKTETWPIRGWDWVTAPVSRKWAQ